MDKFRKTALAGAAASALFLNTLMPAFAATTIEISGNANDDNKVEVQSEKTTAVNQSNNATVKNEIQAKANTGDNEANRNAGGTVKIDTGNASVDTKVKNELNTNVAEVDRCGGCGVQDATIKVTGNTNDDNKVELELENVSAVTQQNNAKVNNEVESKAITGKNEANRNAGGTTDITTGNASTETKVKNTLNSNEAKIGGGHHGENGGVNVDISGNTNDDNKVDLDLASATLIDQQNSAYVKNEVESKSNSGKNEAERNAGGDVEITTGDVWNDTHVKNILNSNSAMITGGHGDSEGVSARIVGNANKGDNKLDLELGAETLVAQSNRGYVKNDVDSFGNSGDNEAERNAGGSVAIDTGDVDMHIKLDTMANFNYADVECDCLFDSLLAKIAGNTNDDNKIKAELADALYVDQDNCGRDNIKEAFAFGRFGRGSKCGIENEVEAYGQSGDNEAERNAGDVGSDPSIMTGDADIQINATNSGNSNVYGNPGSFEWPFPTGEESSTNVNITFNLGDLLSWLLG